MVAITPDSPIGAVFGASHKKRKLAEEGLGLRTVGDLLRHFPRRYVASTELSEVAAPVVGEHLTIVGEVRSCESAPFTAGNRRQWRTTVRLRTDGPDFSVTLFSPYQAMAQRHEDEFRPGSRAIFTGKAKQFRQSWQLEQPHGFALDGAEAASMSKLMPVYPLTAKLYSWDLQKVIATTLDLVTGVPDVFTPELRERFELLTVTQALRWIHAPDEWSQLGAAQKRFRFEEALVLQLVLARRRAAHRAVGAQARAGRDDGVLAAFDARLPFELTGGQREIGDLVASRAHPLPPDEPAAPGRGRLRQDPRRAAGDAAGRRRRRPGGPAGTHRGAGPAAPPLDQRDARRPRPGRDARRCRGGHHGRAAHRLHGPGGPAGGHAPHRHRRGRHRDRHPRPPRGPRRVRRPRPRRRRRAAPLRRRAARGPDRQGGHAPARPGDDRDARSRAPWR